VKALLARGDEVFGISRSAEPNIAFLPYRWDAENTDGFHFVRGDINNGLEAITTLLDKLRPQLIINFAAQSMVAESWQNPLHWYRTNVLSTVALLERLRHCDYVDRYIHVTTPEVYGSTGGVVREDAPFRPSTPYAVSRAAGDMHLSALHAAYGFPVVLTRAANVYGPGQQLYRIIPKAMLTFRTGGRLPLHGGGRSERSFIHITDVINATLLAAERGDSGATYHISTRRWISIRELIELVCSVLGTDFSRHVEIVGDRLGKDAAYRLDSSKIRNELGWADSIDLENGLADTLQWLDKSFDTLRHLPAEYHHQP